MSTLFKKQNLYSYKQKEKFRISKKIFPCLQIFFSGKVLFSSSKQFPDSKIFFLDLEVTKKIGVHKEVQLVYSTEHPPQLIIWQ